MFEEFMFEEFIGLLSLWFGLYLLYKLNPVNIDPFLRTEAERVLYNNAEVDDDWNSEGRVYGTGLSLIKMKNGRKKFIKTAKLCDSGIIHD